MDIATALQKADSLDPVGPCGHERGLRVSTRLTSDYRATWRSHSMDVKPQEVMDCLNDAGVTDWCLMGLHGYVGYMPMPRATQDVDVMVPRSQKKKAVKAISTRWPELQIQDLEPVVRFLDPGEQDRDGHSLPVIDLMLPWSPFQETILKEHVIVDKVAGTRVPTVEAAVVSKYAALISPTRSRAKLAYDAGDLRRLLVAAGTGFDVAKATQLAEQVYAGGGQEIQRFIDCALNDKPFPV